MEQDIQHRLAPEFDSGFRCLGPDVAGNPKPKRKWKGDPKCKAENCTLDCYLPHVTPRVSKQSDWVGWQAQILMRRILPEAGNSASFRYGFALMPLLEETAANSTPASQQAAEKPFGLSF